MSQTGTVTASPDTVLLREGTEPEYARLRTLLAKRGLDPDAVALATFFPDDGHLHFGIVVTAEGRVFEFDFVYEGPGDIRTSVANAVLSEWEETTGTWRDRPFGDAVGEAIEFLAGPG